MKCWCGSTFDPVVSKTKLIADSKCAAPCKGDTKDICGGSNYQMSVYTTPLNPSTGTTAGSASTNTMVRRSRRAHGHLGGLHHARQAAE